MPRSGLGDTPLGMLPVDLGNALDLNGRLLLASIPLAPAATNVLAGQANTGGQVLLTIPAGRTWQGWLTACVTRTHLSGVTSAGAVAAEISYADIHVVGVGSTPANGQKLIEVVAKNPEQAATSTKGTVANAGIATFATVIAGANPVTLNTGVFQADFCDCTANGVLIA